MRLLGAWLIAAAVVVLGLVLSSVGVLIAARHIGPDPVYTVLLVHVPWILILLAATVAAALVQRERQPMPRHLAAVFGVPALALVGEVVWGIAQGAVWGGVISAAEVAVGAALGWPVTRRFTRHDEGSYFPAY